ncbi:MAG: alpha-xylosidase [Fimbriimonas sp.]|nr:alpha-xylosidase [Fimbriimonas sp.]
MKFTDGNWMMQKGVRAHYAAEAYDVEEHEGGLRIYAPTRPIRHRGDTLEGPLLTIDIWSPAPDVVGVRITNLKGVTDHGPAFPLFDVDATNGHVDIQETFAALTGGRLTARVSRTDWGIEFEADGMSVTRSPGRGIGFMEVEGKGVYMQDQLNLGVGECVYGLGERFTSFVKNGQVVEIWNKDGGTGSDQAYKNVPFYLTNRGYGVFVNNPGDVSFEVASEKVSRVQFCVPGQSLEYYVIYGPTPSEVLQKYARLTGMPALPPAWSFGLWLTTSFTTSYDERTCTEFIQGMADRDLPLHVFHFDCFWMREFNWCDFKWDPRTFPDPAGMLKRLKERGLRICVWINPYIGQRSSLFEEGMRQGYLLKKPNGDVWQTEQWQPGMGIVDFTNPDATDWYCGLLAELVDMGVDCFKTDFGERIPTDVVYHDGSDPVRMHNFYPYLYNQAVFELLRRMKGIGNAALFARSATAGCQQYPVHWGGDCYSSFESMAESLRGGLSLCLSGFGFWSHDIGGFEGTPPVEVYKRWIAFGLLSTHSRLHGSSSYRVPWVYDTEAVDVLRFFTQLKCRLMPYLFRQAIETSRTGVPMMQAMMLAFPHDPGCDTLDRQYMLGDSLLVAPVLSSDGSVDYYVPEGRWTNLITGGVHQGPAWVRETHGFLTAPLLVRPNSILPVGSRDDRPDYVYAKGVTFEVYELADGGEASASVPDVTGSSDAVLSTTAVRNGSKITVIVSERSSPVPLDWKVLLVGIRSFQSVTGGRVTVTDRGLIVEPDQDTVSVEIG